MSEQQIKNIIENSFQGEGLKNGAVKGVQLFRVTSSVQCSPVVYEPSIIAIVNGSKEAVWDGSRHIYDSKKYLCCSMSMPVEAGSPNASKSAPLLGVQIVLDSRVMTELSIELESAPRAVWPDHHISGPQGIGLSSWDDAFSEALLRLLQLEGDPARAAILGEGRLRELYYAVLCGEAGPTARRAFGVGNDIARSIAFLSARLDEAVSIEELASMVGMSRAVFHRKFKQATSMSPIQFAKALKLNSAAMRIAQGVPVTTAAMDVGYVSSSQFSREFKRLYGQSPKSWGLAAQVTTGIA